MENLTHRHEGLRILLRRQGSQEYLQPNGEWAENRQTARRFNGTIAAYSWVVEQKLRGVEILMAFDNERWDVVTMRI